MRMCPVWRAGMSEMISFSSVVVVADARLVRRFEIWEDKIEACFSSESFLGLGLGLGLEGSLLLVGGTVGREKASLRYSCLGATGLCDLASASLHLRDVEHRERAGNAVGLRLDITGVRHAFCPTKRIVAIV